MTRRSAGVVLAIACAAPLLADVGAAGQAPPAAGLPSRSTTAVTYEARRTTTVDLVGTPLLPRARGRAEVETEAAGPVRIAAEMRGLAAPAQFGAEYLTYVAWAVPPQGRAKNLGELRLDDGEAEIEATADVQTFALIVTAEPYYAVTIPSDVVVLENVAREDTRGRTSIATLTHEIVPRGAYVAAGGSGYRLPAPGRREPPDVQQARNAVAIARIAQADRFATSGLATAERLLAQAEQLVASRESSRDIVSQARAAVQAAEEARLQATERVARETARAAREEAAAREAAALAAAAEQGEARRAADEERRQAERAAQQATRERAQAEAARREAEQARAEADRARGEAERARAAAETHAARAEALRAAAERDRLALRARLFEQFNAILRTRDTARGLIVDVGDVLFETGRYTLRPGAREKLARFAGIVLAHEGLSVRAEGFTDATGSAAANERLSQQRADAVADYLVAQGLPRERIAAVGFGSRHPVAANETAHGRSQNRRVELVVAGEVIGAPVDAARR
jgi:outer membrane protein OmpA-like peptidoglycan-associated protein